jgi:hypothetical protein
MMEFNGVEVGIGVYLYSMYRYYRGVLRGTPDRLRPRLSGEYLS